MLHRYTTRILCLMILPCTIQIASANEPDMTQKFQAEYPAASAQLEKLYTHARMVTIRTSQYKRDGKQHVTKSVVTNLRRDDASLWNQRYIDTTSDVLSKDTQIIFMESPTLSFSATRRSDEKEFVFEEYKTERIEQDFPPSPYSILDIKLINLIAGNPINAELSTYDGGSAIKLIIDDIKNKNKPIVFLDPKTWAILAWEIPTKGETLRGRNTYENPSAFPPKLTSFMNLEEIPDSGIPPRYSRDSKVIDLQFVDIPAETFSLVGAGITQPPPSYDIIDISKINPHREPSLAETQPGTQPTISEEVRGIFSQINQWRENTRNLIRKGSISILVSKGDRSQEQQIQFTSTFSAPNLFRYETPKRLIIGCDGKFDYIAALGMNSYHWINSHSTQPAGLDLMDTRFALSDKYAITHTEDPTLGLLLDADPATALCSNATAISIFKPNESYLTGLQIETSLPSKLVRRYWFDTSSGLLVHTEFKFTFPPTDVNSPTEIIAMRIDYSQTQMNAQVSAASFDFAPPPRSRDLTDKWPSLIGTPAPSFTLTDTNGQICSRDDLKGQVVLLDFWASWCNYCIDGLDELQKHHAEFSAKNIKILAIGKDEDQTSAAAFARQKKYSFSICPDPDAAISACFGVDGFPQTVIIGKDGKIKDIVIGSGAKAFERIQKTIESANRE